ncbi:MAG: hypothetical protein H5T98_00995 [Syntrophomonadaceae bacterium]|nr:hypothetical protein [Syntrophomonadaceae bacterium]
MTIRSVYIDATGIHAPTYSDIYSDLVAVYQGIFGADVYLGSDSQDGQLIGILAQAFTDTNNAIVAAYNSFSPAYAQGAGLASMVKINGLAKLVPTNSTAVVDIVGQAGKQISNGVAEDVNGIKWNLPALVTIGIGGTVTTTATCATLGAITAQANTITKISTPTQGWQSITNPAAATVGAPAETDPQLRIRQSKSTAQPAQTVIGAIYAAIANVPGVTALEVYENDTDVADANGIPAHSISPVVGGGNVLAVAQAIQLRKPPGTQTYGTTSQQVTDPVGLPITINWFELAQIQIYAAITIVPLTGYVSTTGTLIQEAIAAAINAGGIGGTVYMAKMYAAATLSGDAATSSSGLTQAQLDALSATYSITSLAIGTAANPTGTSNIAIAFNAAPVSSVANVALTA